jgi:hypothetical protein
MFKKFNIYRFRRQDTELFISHIPTYFPGYISDQDNSESNTNMNNNVNYEYYNRSKSIGALYEDEPKLCLSLINMICYCQKFAIESLHIHARASSNVDFSYDILVAPFHISNRLRKVVVL